MFVTQNNKTTTTNKQKMTNVTDEKIYEHIDPGSPKHGRSQITLFHNCATQPPKGLVPITSKKSSGWSHLCCLATVSRVFRICSWLYPDFLSPERNCEELSETRWLLSSGNTRLPPSESSVCFLTSRLLPKCAIKSWANLTLKSE